MKVTMNCIDRTFIGVAVCPTRNSVSGSPKMCDVTFDQCAVVVSPQPTGENSAGWLWYRHLGEDMDWVPLVAWLREETGNAIELMNHGSPNYIHMLLT